MSVAKEDLIGKLCHLIAEIPPKDTKIGMKLLTVRVLQEEGKKVFARNVSVLVTQTDVTEMIRINPKPFTFEKVADKAYPQVRAYEQ